MSELEVATGVYWAEVRDATEILQSSEQTPQIRITQPHISIVPQLRNCPKAEPFHSLTENMIPRNIKKKKEKEKKPKSPPCEKLIEGPAI